MSANLFAYGTLQIDTIMQAVTGVLPESQAARLHDFARYRVADQTYPGIVPKPGAQTPGRLYRGLAPETWARLDQFEGDLYIRQSVTVVTSDGTTLPAQTYVIKPDQRTCLTAQSWDLNTFIARHQNAFMRTYYRPRMCPPD